MLKKNIRELSIEESLPNNDYTLKAIDLSINSICLENINIRPRDINNNPGGVLNLGDKDVIIIPDLHGRREYLAKIILKFYQELENNNLYILFLGDFLHTEVTTKDRWLLAYDEYLSDFKDTEHMDKEICDNLYTLIILAEIKSKFPQNIFFLKGNHDNILNSNDLGNRAFRKYAMEGDMIYSYIKTFYGIKLIEQIDKLESLYPIIAFGNNFIASHSEPMEFYDIDELINYKNNPELIYNLTWTRNGQADPRIVKFFLDMNQKKKGVYIVGHTHISGKYKLFNNGNLLQIHNPFTEPYLLAKRGNWIRPDKDIYNLGDISNG